MNKLNHVAFIMDGNGRWGKKKRKSRNLGHLAGVNTVKKIVDASIKFRIPIVTFYVFSTENWKRPQREIKYLFNLIETFFKKEINNVIKNKIKIKIVGERKSMPKKLIKVLNIAESKTKNNKAILVNLALNYGSKDEILRSFKKIEGKKKINQNDISNNLYTKNIPDPEILIRTGGKKRLSNFMLWQLAYSELYFVKKLWPDFNKNDLKNILKDYKKIKRNFGGI
tara:strand:- start:675 stop:1349 length:675 start_codon:yes stop_codon:yes gene_type:complete